MKAAKWYGKKDIRIEDIPVPPAPGPGEAQIKVAWCGICGSDLHEYLAGPIFIPVEPHPLTGAKAPLVLGHEFSGEVVAVGEDVETVRVGDFVAPDACQHCGVCVNCREGRYNVCEKLAFTGLMADGAFAEYVNVPAELCYVLPDDFDLEAASLIEPLATGFKAARMAGSLLGHTAVVLGAGTIGLGTIMCAKAAGAAPVIAVETAAAIKVLGLWLLTLFATTARLLLSVSLKSQVHSIFSASAARTKPSSGPLLTQLTTFRVWQNYLPVAS